MDFDLWLEFEHIDGVIDDFANVGVTLADGRRYALNVWAFDFFAVARSEGELKASDGLRGDYMFPPDLFVAELTRPALEAVVGDMVRAGTLPARCLLTGD